MLALWALLIAAEVALILRGRPIVRWLTRTAIGGAAADTAPPVATVATGRAAVRIPQFIGDTQGPTERNPTRSVPRQRTSLSEVTLLRPEPTEPPLLFDEFRAEIAAADPEFRTGTTTMFRRRVRD